MTPPSAQPPPPEARRTWLIFGGSFDPPHVAHVALPRQAMHAVGAQAVAYVAAATPPHKRHLRQTPARQRLAMLRLALQAAPWAQVLTDELDRAARRPHVPSFTVDTLEALRARLGPAVTLRLLIGADQLMIFPQWRRYERIVELAEPAVMVRPPMTRRGLLAALPAPLRRREWAGRLLDTPRWDISSSDIRQRVAAGAPVTGLVAPAVEDYIRRQGLYR